MQDDKGGFGVEVLTVSNDTTGGYLTWMTWFRRLTSAAELRSSLWLFVRSGLVASEFAGDAVTGGARGC